MAERPHDAVEKRLASDEPDLRMRGCLTREMLAGAEADLDMQRAIVAEQSRCVVRPDSGTDNSGSISSTSADWPWRSLWPWRRP